MALHLILGNATADKHTRVDVVYLGRDADQARAAQESYSGHSTLWLRNPTGVRKISPRVAAARDALTRDEDAARIAALPAAPPTVEQQLAAAERENRKLRRALEQAVVAPSIPAQPEAPVDTLPLVLHPEPVVSPVVEATGEEDGPAAEEIVLDASATPGDPDAEARRKEALDMAAAAEEVEKAPKSKKR